MAQPMRQRAAAVGNDRAARTRHQADHSLLPFVVLQEVGQISRNESSQSRVSECLPIDSDFLVGVTTQ